MKQEDIMKLEAAIAADYSNIAGMVVRKDGETDDKIAYAFSDATIIAAQSMYAEKFIAPAGRAAGASRDCWSRPDPTSTTCWRLSTRLPLCIPA